MNYSHSSHLVFANSRPDVALCSVRLHQIFFCAFGVYFVCLTLFFTVFARINFFLFCFIISIVGRCVAIDVVMACLMLLRSVHINDCRCRFDTVRFQSFLNPCVCLYVSIWKQWIPVLFINAIELVRMLGAKSSTQISEWVSGRGSKRNSV